MNISLPPQLESFVRTKVDSGNYTSASEVIREALRVFQLYESLEQKRFLLQAIEEGLDSGRSKLFDPESIKKKARKR